MKGGRILGEGVDGCVFSEPLWPCAASSKVTGEIPSGSDKSVVAKIVKKDDIESVYLNAANRILGSELSKLYLAGLRGSCSPANDSHKPEPSRKADYVHDKKALEGWKEPDQACEELKGDIEENGITLSHKVMFISRYPSTLEEWIETIKSRSIPVNYILGRVNLAIPPFLSVLQRFYKNSTEELINTDLHHKNIFIRVTDNNLQFGISDFGRCLLRTRSDPASNFEYFYMSLDTFRRILQPIYIHYRQIPFEIRLIQYCYLKNMENQSPLVLINALMRDKDIIEYQKYTNDIISINHHKYMEYLSESPLFIEMIETMQGLVKKMRIKVMPGLTQKEQIIMEFIVTRYMAVSPLVTILEQLLYLSKGDELYNELVKISTARFSGQSIPTTGSGIFHIVEYINRIVLAPYATTGVRGSSLTDAVSSVQSADLGLIWSDIV